VGAPPLVPRGGCKRIWLDKQIWPFSPPNTLYAYSVVLQYKHYTNQLKYIFIPCPKLKVIILCFKKILYFIPKCNALEFKVNIFDIKPIIVVVIYS